MKFSFNLAQPKKKKEYDVVIIGAGPAGCTAAIYAKRYTLDALVISKDFGGLIADAEIVDNYPALPEIKGSDLSQRFVDHMKKYGVESVMANVEKIEKVDEKFRVFFNGDSVDARAVIIATGEKHRKLSVPGEEEFAGRGVSYCAICDAPLFKDKIVAVIGGGNTAVVDAQLLAKYASKVYLVHRRSSFRADPIEIENVKSNKKIEIVTPYVVKEIKGNNKVEKVLLKKVKEESGKIVETEEIKELNVNGVFVDVGLVPNTEIVKNLGVKLNNEGYIVVDDAMKTSVEGVFAAGDCTDKASQFRQVVLAAAQGAIAATSVYRYLKKQE